MTKGGAGLARPPSFWRTDTYSGLSISPSNLQKENWNTKRMSSTMEREGGETKLQQAEGKQTLVLVCRTCLSFNQDGPFNLDLRMKNSRADVCVPKMCVKVLPEISCGSVGAT